jgi:dTDP-4-dehydrorhamnose 3,5-epimerase
MEFRKTSLQDAALIDLTKFEDSRGFFARTFCAEEFSRQGLVTQYPQSNYSYNVSKGTLRGMHYQKAPYGEVKLVRVVQGAILDVIIDLRPSSPTYLKWEGFELTAENARTLYVPVGFAHGFQTLVDETHVTYQVSHSYTPGAEGGLRYNDPAFGIKWPLPVGTVSDKDASWPDVDPAAGIPI